METVNPDQPPLTDLSDASVDTHSPVTTRWQATREGMRCGAILGVKVAVVFCALVLLFDIYIIIVSPETFYADFDLSYGIIVGIAKLAGEIIVGFILLIIYCAVPGGILMGLIKMIRFHKVQSADNNKLI